MTADELLRRRLVFTVGKGGVGRTTVALALGLEAARRGKRVLLAELEGAHGLGHALARQREAHEQAPGLERIGHLVVDGRRALEEYLALVIPVRRLLRTIFSSQVYQYFVAAAPGLKELMTVGKIWYEAERRERDKIAPPPPGAPAAPDVVIVDGPATGHSLQYLRMPQAAHEAFPVGLVHREAERVLGLLRDATATAVAIVTTAEEMPANETAEIYAGLGDLRLPRTLLVINQVREPPCSEAELAALRPALRAQRAPGSAGKPGRRRAPRDGRGVAAVDRERLLGEVLRRAEEECGWAEITRQNVERLARSVPLPTVKLPFLFAEEFGAEQVRRLAGLLAAQLDGVAAPAQRALPGGRGR